MAKVKRKDRKDLAKDVDITKPIPLEIFGSDDDPCFGKHNDPRHPICQRCGDIEICAIAMGQNNHMKRLMAEKKEPFKDLEEAEIPKRDVRKEARKAIKECIKAGGMTKEQIIKDVYGKYLHHTTQKKITRLVDIVSTKYGDSIIIKNGKYSWKRP